MVTTVSESVSRYALRLTIRFVKDEMKITDHDVSRTQW